MAEVVGHTNIAGSGPWVFCAGVSSASRDSRLRGNDRREDLLPMNANTCETIRNFNPSYAVRAAAGLGLVLIMTFAGSARADDVVFGFAADMGGTGDA